jgi:IS66 Orf2 like protein
MQLIVTYRNMTSSSALSSTVETSLAKWCETGLGGFSFSFRLEKHISKHKRRANGVSLGSGRLEHYLVHQVAAIMIAGSLVKNIWHDGTGMSLYVKRIDKGRFIWPSAMDGVVSLTSAQLACLLDGID